MRTEISQDKCVATRDKDFFVVTNSLARDKDQRRKLCRDKRKLCRDKVVEKPKKSYHNIENSIAIEYTS